MTFIFVFRPKMNVYFRFRFVFGRKWNFIFVGIFVYGRKWKMFFGRPLVYITKRSWDAKSWSLSWTLGSLGLSLESKVLVAHKELPSISNEPDKAYRTGSPLHKEGILTDGLNFDSAINNFAERKSRKVCKFSTDLMPCGSSLTQTVYVYEYCNKMKV